MKKIVTIIGPTGVGKTKISIELAKAFNAEIINADASQIYKELNIGTAKISLDEMKGIKHYLLNFLNINEQFSIKEYQKIGREIIDKSEKNIFVVGGSGLYVNALLYDYDLNSKPRDYTKYEHFSNQELYQLLLEKNYEKAIITHPNNRRRVERYLELSEEESCSKPPLPIYNNLNICLYQDRDILYNKIDKRCDEMFEKGWIEECKLLKKQGYNLNDIKEIGYSDINDYLDLKISLEEVKNIIKQKTRRYAKRQMTWFRNKIDCKFIDINNTSLNEIKKLINTFYNDIN